MAWNPKGLGNLPIRKTALYVAAVLVVAAFVLSFVLLRNTWTNAVLSVPFFFVVPMGIGLLFLPISAPRTASDPRIPLSTITIVATSIGFVFASWFAQIGYLFDMGVFAAFATMMVIAALGFLRSRRLFGLNARLFDVDFQHNAPMLLLLTCFIAVAAAVNWWVHFGAFSRFPFTDLFAETHILKAAVEYASSSLVNSSTAASYIPVTPALLGGLNATLGTELFKSIWQINFWTPVFYLIALWGFFQGLYADSRRRWLSLAFVAGGIPFSLPTNGTLASISGLAAASMLFSMSGYLRKLDLEAGSVRNTHVVRLFALVVSIAGTLTPILWNNDGISSPFLIVTALVLSLLLRFLPNSNSKYHLRSLGSLLGVLFLAAYASVMLHRGGLMFMTAVIGLWLSFELCIALRDRFPSGFGVFLWSLALALPIASALVSCIILAVKFNLLSSSIDVVDLYSSVTQVVIGHKIDPTDDLALGFGGSIAFVELIRFVGPIFSIMAGVIALFWLISNRPRQLARRFRESAGAIDVLVPIWAWIGGAALLLGILSGFPFAYRTAFLSVLLLGAATAGMWTDLRSTTLDRKQESSFLPPWAKAANMLLFLLFVALALGALGLIPVEGERYSGYQALFRPTLMAITLAALIFLLAIWFGHGEQVRTGACVLFIFLIFAADRAGMTVYMQPFSYGPQQQNPHVISHYNGNDLAAADWIKQNRPQALLISDPYTLSLATAVTGDPTLYLYSNLDTVNPAVAQYVKSIIGTIADPSDPRHALNKARMCLQFAGFVRDLNEEARAQIFRDRTTIFAGVMRARVGAQRSEETPYAVEVPAPLAELNANIAKLNPSVPAPGPDEAPSASDSAKKVPPDSVAKAPAESGSKVPPEPVTRVAPEPVTKIPPLQLGKIVPHDLMKAFGKDGKWKVVLIVNPRTLAWVASAPDQRVSYFPPIQQLDSDVRQALAASQFPLAANIDNRSFILDVDCLSVDAFTATP
jgi:hypothetical protein